MRRISKCEYSKYGYSHHIRKKQLIHMPFTLNLTLRCPRKERIFWSSAELGKNAAEESLEQWNYLILDSWISLIFNQKWNYNETFGIFLVTINYVKKIFQILLNRFYHNLLLMLCTFIYTFLMKKNFKTLF